MKIPSSTYRIQFNKDFTFRHLADTLDYIHGLGATTIYAAPILKSRPGSLHGYDVVDPLQIDPEIGTLEEFRDLTTKLKGLNMTWIQDIVPNHMAFSTDNLRLMDVLERGPQSEYYRFFDIDWDHPSPELKGKLMVPFLGKPLEECLQAKEVALEFIEAKGFVIKYFDTTYPLSVRALNRLPETLRTTAECLMKMASSGLSLEEWATQKNEWLSEAKGCKKTIDAECEKINANMELLRTIVTDQYYTLTFWKDSERMINYRRFFTVNELICLRMEDQFVFDEYHQLIHKLVEEGLIQGVRIDHIDGLFDPAGYVSKLRKLLGKDCYIIAEKILEASEMLPENWQLEGTSGYEFLSYVSQLFTDRKGARKLVDFYLDLVPDLPPYDTLVFRNKKLILEQYMAGEASNLTDMFYTLKLGERFDRTRMKLAISLFMIALPVYRIYPTRLPLAERERSLLEEAFRKAYDRGHDLVAELDWLKTLFLDAEASQRANALKFLQRLMQFTGPLTAKGVEDTTFYVYNPLISHDEVGDAPSTLGISIAAFHKKMDVRQRQTPLSLNATATHDTKRGEDARLRVNVLSEMPDVWIEHVRSWMELNKQCRASLPDGVAPSVNDEYFIYQSLVGGYPENLIGTAEYFERFNEFLVKALREAKVHTNWSDPNTAYEEACTQFVKRIFEETHAFKASFLGLVQIVMRYAHLHALGQVLIKITSPGIPDMYQGTALWDLSYVDPDNRRSVDFATRLQMLNTLRQLSPNPDELLQYLRANRSEGAEKLFVTWKGLQVRKQLNQVFINGSYLPLQVSKQDAIVISYARCHGDRWVVVMVPLGLAKSRETDQPYADLPDPTMFVKLPEDAPVRWRNVFTGEVVQTKDSKILLFDAFKDFSVALFVNE